MALATFEIKLRADWKQIESLRTVVRALLETAAPDRVAIHEAAAMAVTELMQNTIEHGIPGGNVELRLRLEPVALYLEVVNEVGGLARQDELVRHLEWIRSQPSPAIAFRELLRRLLTAPDGHDGSARLGLARVASEGDFDVWVDRRGPDRVAVFATRNWSGGAEIGS